MIASAPCLPSTPPLCRTVSRVHRARCAGARERASSCGQPTGWHRVTPTATRSCAAWVAASRTCGRGRLLDVGCGAGDLLVALRADGWSVYGVEPQALGAARARDEHRLDVLTGRFEDVRLPEGSFDAIVFSGVFEHLHVPVAALCRARALLAPGGLVAVLFLPMLDSPEARLLGPRWMALDLPRHLTHFEEATFTEMARKAGLDVAGRETYSRRHNPAQLVGSLAPRLQKHRFYAAENGPKTSAA